MFFFYRFLDEVKHRDLYVSLCFISRMLEANGASMMSVASFAIMANQFQKNVGSALVSDLLCWLADGYDETHVLQFSHNDSQENYLHAHDRVQQYYTFELIYQCVHRNGQTLWKLRNITKTLFMFRSIDFEFSLCLNFIPCAIILSTLVYA